MSFAFKTAYEAAEDFSRLYARRCPGAGFLKTILLRRIGSSARAGLETARHLLGRSMLRWCPKMRSATRGCRSDDAPPDPQEIEFLREVERNLAAVVAGTDIDPKVAGDPALSARAAIGWRATARSSSANIARRRNGFWKRSARRSPTSRSRSTPAARLRSSSAEQIAARRRASRSSAASRTAKSGWSARPMRHARASTFSGSARKSISTCPGTRRASNSAKAVCSASAKSATTSMC